MNKLVLYWALPIILGLLLPASSAEKEAKISKRRRLLDDLCAKCRYCETDPECGGCSRCDECKTKSHALCRFCKKDEEEKDCIKRCTKGCRICSGLISCDEKNKN